MLTDVDLKSKSKSTVNSQQSTTTGQKSNDPIQSNPCEDFTGNFSQTGNKHNELLQVPPKGTRQSIPVLLHHPVLNQELKTEILEFFHRDKNENRGGWEWSIQWYLPPTKIQFHYWYSSCLGVKMDYGCLSLAKNTSLASIVLLRGWAFHVPSCPYAQRAQWFSVF